MRGLALLILASFCAGPIRAQNGRITGQVFEKGSRNVVPTAEVMLLKTKFHVWTGLDGRFTLEKIPAGDYELTAVGGGFLPSSTQSVRVGANQTTSVTVLLNKPFFQGDEIVVKGERTKSAGQQGLTREELKKIPGTFDDPMRGLQAMPGVAAPHDFSSTFLLRGGGEYDNQIMIDGVPIDLPFHLGGMVSSIHPEAVKSADLYSGGYGARFGNALGGAMDVTTREPRRDRFATKLNFNPILPDGIVDVPLPGNGGLLFAGRRSYIDLLFKNVKGLTVAPVFQDGIIKVSYDIADRGVISLTGLGASDGFAYQSENSSSTNKSRFFTHYQREALGWKWYWTDAVKSDVVLYHGSDGLLNDQREAHHGDPEKITAVDLKTQLFGGRAEVNVEWHPNVKTIVGGAYEDKKAKISGTFQDFINEFNHSAGVNRNDLALNGDYKTASAYVEQKIQLLEPLWISVGGRFDRRDGHFSAVNITSLTARTDAGKSSESHFSPRASFELALGEKSKLRGAWGKYYQWPSLNTPPFQALGNAQLRAQEADHYVLGIERQFPSDVFARVEGFYKNMKNLIVDQNPDLTANQHDFITNQHNLQNSGSGNCASIGIGVKSRYRCGENAKGTDKAGKHGHRKDKLGMHFYKGHR